MTGAPWNEVVRDRSLVQALEQIRAAAGRVVKKQLLAHYTDHGINHLDQVARNFVALTHHSKSTSLALSEQEYFVGLASCFLHDVALQRTIKGKTKGVGELRPDDYDAIRQSHGRAAAEWILWHLKPRSQSAEDLELPDLGIPGDDFVRGLINKTVPLVRFHMGEIDEAKVVDERFVGGQVRLPLLLRLLRIADGLHLDQARVDMTELFQREIPVVSLEHWWRHHYTDSVDIEANGNIIITMGFPPNASRGTIDYFRRAVDNYIRAELGQAEDLLRENEIFLKLKPILYHQENCEYKRLPPAELDARIAKEDSKPGLAAEGPVPGENAARTLGVGRPAFELWGVRGNPWSDSPVSIHDARFVQTQSMQEILADAAYLLDGRAGELRLVFAERGGGKSSLMETLFDRYAAERPTCLIDMSYAPEPITSPERLYQDVFAKIYTRLFKRAPPAGFTSLDANDFRDGVSELESAPVVLVDNLDRYSEEPDQEIIRRFFQLAQGNLQALGRRGLVVISATTKWRAMFEDLDLSYLGPKNFWNIDPLSSEEIWRLLERRLVDAGSTYGRVFAGQVYREIHQLSAGNPRQAINVAQIVFEHAAREARPKIDRDYIVAMYRTRMQEIVARHAVDITRENADLAPVLNAITAYLTHASRVIAGEDLAINLLLRALDAVAPVEANEVPIELRAGFSRLFRLHTEIRNGEELHSWIAHERTLSFFAAVKNRGFTANEFLREIRHKKIHAPAKNESGIDRALRLLDGLPLSTLALQRVQGLRDLRDGTAKNGGLDRGQAAAALALACDAACHIAMRRMGQNSKYTPLPLDRLSFPFASTVRKAISNAEAIVPGYGRGPEANVVVKLAPANRQDLGDATGTDMTLMRLAVEKEVEHVLTIAARPDRSRQH